MKESAKRLIRNVLLGAVASLCHTGAQAADTPSLPSEEDDDGKDMVRALKNKIYRNVLRITADGGTKLIAGHRSHMSHRSGGGGGGHYSHASHYSSYGGGGSSHSSHASHSSSSYGTTYSAPKTYKTYTLGERTLSQGVYGNDVSELTALLVAANYLRGSWVSTQKGYSVYDARVVAAVRRFQKDAGLPQTGKFTKTLVSSLEAWDSGRTTLALGVRNLAYDKATTTVGDDVAELIALLRGAGFPPDPSKLRYAGHKAVFTADVRTAVKMFQAYNGLTPDGEVTEAFVAKLRAAAKQ